MDTNEVQYESGYQLGFVRDNEYYLNNHLKFILKYHNEKSANLYRVVGFEIETYSVNAEKIELAASGDDKTSCKITAKENEFQKLEEGKTNKIRMSYEVVWQQSDIPWASRWDTYLKMNDVKIHWFSIINSLVVVFFLAGIISMILVRSLRRDIAKYNREDEPVFYLCSLVFRFQASIFFCLMLVLLGRGDRRNWLEVGTWRRVSTA